MITEELRAYMREIGRKGGQAKSARKAEAVRKNGTKNKPQIKLVKKQVTPQS